MTVKELKEKLERLPSDADIHIQIGYEEAFSALNIEYDMEFDEVTISSQTND